MTATAKNMRELDAEMRNVLEGEDDNPDDVTSKRYNELMNRFLNYGQKRRRDVVGESNINDTSQQTDQTTFITKQVLESVPSRFRTKARLLLDKIRLHPDVVTWNDRGQLVVRGQTVSNTNITDLVNDVVRARKDFEPVGWETFATALKDIDVPQEFIGHRKRWNWMQKQQQPSGVSRKQRRLQRVGDVSPSTKRTRSKSPQRWEQWRKKKV